MTRQLRQGKGRHGLILANGGWMTYQHVLCLSTMRRRDGVPYPAEPPLPEYVADVPVPPVDATVEDEAEAVIEVCKTNTVSPYCHSKSPSSSPLDFLFSPLTRY